MVIGLGGEQFCLSGHQSNTSVLALHISDKASNSSVRCFQKYLYYVAAFGVIYQISLSYEPGGGRGLGNRRVFLGETNSTDMF